MLMAVIAGTCTVVYQSGSKNVPNEKEFVLNEGDSIDEAMKTEEKETTEENRNSETQNPESKDPETQDVNTSQVEGERVMEEETEEPEYFKDHRLQVSIFKNIFNVHINWFPVNGVIKYFKYHKGNFAAAYLPKSSTDNERTTIDIESNNGKTVQMRQNARPMANRIIS